ncbi:hypothetical protein GCM10011519_27000 [Marmoricola endophyticus]|uniref:2-nitropropane dioxygenase n=2 Tax=Marmoricola endophyticus TaxID=2040280 RepID=A0A917F6N6_9ACTN|nr:nucleotidyltransferase family protein [Marmoricola endophyticus]GGF51608.1 hypothetical protein GCM10011519_27000 [Marmoricola endophyticus]
MDAVEVGLQARVRMAHATLGSLATEHRLDLLHVKGPALDPALTGEGERSSSDADVLIRPGHVDRLVSLLVAHHWRLVTGFARGSAFEHAANYRHPHWGYADLHRSFPGLTVPAADAFDALWADRATTRIAHVECAVPSLLDQGLLLLLHAARDGRSTRAQHDVRRAWEEQPASARSALRERADGLGAEVALAAALGELGRHADDRTAALWRYYSEGGSRLDELRARVRAAPTPRAKLRVAADGLRVNPEYVAMAIGHEPSVAELAQARRERRRNALGDVRDLVRSRLRGRTR